MKVIITRHGETQENVKKIDIGRDSKSLLTQEGVLQARKLGDHLKGERITHAYVSPQKRAVDTAQEILNHHPKAIITPVEHLREQNLGIYESVPKHIWKEAKKNAKDPFHLFKPEKGESYAELQVRATDFFHELLKKHSADDTVLIVSHGGTLGMLLLHVLEKEITEENYKAYKPENTAVTILEISEDGKVNTIVVNSLEHLMEIHADV